MSNAWLLSAILCFMTLQKNSRNCLGVAVQNLLGKSGNPYQPVIIHSRVSKHHCYVILPALLPAFGTKFAVCSCPSSTVPGSLRLKVQGAEHRSPCSPFKALHGCGFSRIIPTFTAPFCWQCSSFHFTKWNSLFVCAGCDSRQGWLNGSARACLSHPAPGVPRLTLSRTVVLVLV